MHGSDGFENYGVPTYYVNVFVTEAAGAGHVRLWVCPNRRGIVAPQCEIIIPAVDLVLASRVMADAAIDAFNMEAMIERRLSS